VQHYFKRNDSDVFITPEKEEDQVGEPEVSPFKLSKHALPISKCNTALTLLVNQSKSACYVVPEFGRLTVDDLSSADQCLSNLLWGLQPAAKQC